MKAVVKFAKGSDGVGLRDIPKPVPGDNEVLVKILAAGICASDIHAILDERETVMPVALGHEFVGTVVEAGKNAAGIAVGDTITAMPACYSCGECIYCKSGEVTLCKQRKSIGSHKNGAMAEYMVCPAKYCFRIPETDEDKIQYAIAEPLACVTHAVYEQLDVHPGDWAVVSGPGAIGLLAVQCLAARGANVVISGLPADRPRMEKALKLGAQKAVDNVQDLEDFIHKVSPLGADISIDCAGAAPSVDNCLKVTRTHGHFLIMGVFGKPVTVDLNKIFLKELVVKASNSSTMSSWEIALDLMARKIVDVRQVLSTQLPIEEWRKGFDIVIDKSAMKVLLIP